MLKVSMMCPRLLDEGRAAKNGSKEGILAMYKYLDYGTPPAGLRPSVVPPPNFSYDF